MAQPPKTRMHLLAADRLSPTPVLSDLPALDKTVRPNATPSMLHLTLEFTLMQTPLRPRTRWWQKSGLLLTSVS